MSESEKRKAAERLLGVLAVSIRDCWNSQVRERCSLMHCLVQEHCADEEDWLDWLEDADNLADCALDGRTIGGWPGPYGGSTTHADWQLLGYPPWRLGPFWQDYVAELAVTVSSTMPKEHQYA